MKKAVCDLVVEVKEFLKERGTIDQFDVGFQHLENYEHLLQWGTLDQNQRDLQLSLTAKIRSTANAIAREYKAVTQQSLPRNIVQLFTWLTQLVNPVSIHLKCSLKDIYKELDELTSRISQTLSSADAMVDALPDDEWKEISKIVGRRTKSKQDIFS